LRVYGAHLGVVCADGCDLHELVGVPPTSGFRVQGSWFMVQGSWFSVQGAGFRV